MKGSLWRVSYLLLLLAGSGLHAQESAMGHRVVLIGDAGERVNGVIPAVKKYHELFVPDSATTFVFLGDNIYPRGMPDAEDDAFAESSRILREQAAIGAGSGARVFFVPGNHDWAQGRPEGWDRIRNQQRYIDSLGIPGVQFLPRNGCPGPEEVVISEYLVIVFMDSQWWLHQNRKPGLESDCNCKNEEEITTALRDIINSHPDKMILVAMHHPLYTHGKHGGHFTLKQHLFPLTEFSHGLYIPLPVIGSIYPLSRSLFGNIQDTKHPVYRSMIDRITEELDGHPNIIHAAGHEHGLQLLSVDSITYIVSGSGSKTTAVKKGKHSLFADSENGFVVMDAHADGLVDIRYYTTSSTSADQPAFATTVRKQLQQPEKWVVNTASFPDSVVVTGSQQFGAGGFKRFLLGGNYRKEWAQPIRVPVIDIGTEKGGLHPTRRGGGHQTKSIRLEDQQGREYVLRSVDKFPTDAALPPNLRGTFVKDLVTDGISASYPYAAVSIPPLAAAAGVFHSNPELVFLPDDPRLGKFRPEFGNKFYLFEERVPAGLDKTYSTSKMHEELVDDNDNRVDQAAFLQARLLDMFVMDFDRHEDQWRWAAIDSGKGKTYLPVPRDRDQPFFMRVGLLPFFASRSWLAPQLQGFRAKAENIRTYNFNARNLDRALLNELSAEEWEKATDAFLALMTDDLIEKSLAQQPEAVKPYHAAWIVSTLKERRKYFKEDMMTYYRFLSRIVTITGSDKHELFEIQADKDGWVQVTVKKQNKEGEISDMLYSRRFDPAVTHEIRIYGLDGEDEFRLQGERTPIRIRMIGGQGKDEFAINGHFSRAKTLVYDRSGQQTSISGSGRFRNKLADNARVNRYDWQSYRYNIRKPFLSATYNPDDGIFLGAFMQWTNRGFRKEPFSSQHTLSVNHALATKAWNFRYNGEFIGIAGGLDLVADADVRAPNSVINFFSLGNESLYDKSAPGKIKYYRARFNLSDISLLLRRQFANKRVSLTAGPTFQYFSMDSADNGNRFITQTATNGLDPTTLYERKLFLGGAFGFSVDTRNNKNIPTRGLYWQNSIRVLRGLNDVSKNVSILSSDLAMYLSFSSPATWVLATRFGGGMTLNGFEFYQSRFLGGTENLRGFRKYRFAGRSMLFNNTELRVKLAEFRTYLFPATLGLLVFHDVGRVWVQNDSSGRWHSGYGGGLWIAPLQQLVITASYTQSDEGGLPLVTFGFQF